MQSSYLRKPSPFLVSPIEIFAATLPYPGDSEVTEQRRASLACYVRNAGRAAIVLTAGLTATGISEYAHSPYSALSALVAVAGAGRLAYTHTRAATITSGLIARGQAETFEQMVVMPGDLSFARPEMPPIPPGVE
jgi:hypothetical protein